jgi:hypothetical protein
MEVGWFGYRRGCALFAKNTYTPVGKCEPEQQSTTKLYK